MLCGRPTGAFSEGGTMDDEFKIILFLFCIRIVLSTLLFFLLRNLNCWYWKINQRITILENIDKKMEKIQNIQIEILNKMKNSSNEQNKSEEHKINISV